MLHKSRCSGSLAAVLMLSCASLGAATIGMVDTFQVGTTQGCEVGGGSPNQPAVQSGGGPSGASDNYLLLTRSGAGGPGSKRF
jgi:hypothetical protein